ncbi:hypothetical protein PAMA_016499 [Pampus argenteus]
MWKNLLPSLCKSGFISSLDCVEECKRQWQVLQNRTWQGQRGKTQLSFVFTESTWWKGRMKLNSPGITPSLFVVLHQPTSLTCLQCLNQYSPSYPVVRVLQD